MLTVHVVVINKTMYSVYGRQCRAGYYDTAIAVWKFVCEETKLKNSNCVYVIATYFGKVVKK